MAAGSEQERTPLERAETKLTWANRMLGAASQDSYSWPQIVLLVGEAEEAIREAQAADPAVQMPLFDEVIAKLRQETRNFTDLEFLRSTRAARRRFGRLYKALI